MARRTHLTELACIACDEFSEFGAGKEGWLVDNPNLLSAIDSNSLALANESIVLVVSWNYNSSSNDDRTAPIKIRPSLSSTEGHITALQWLVFFNDDLRVLAVGTSNGYLLIYSLQGHLIHKQMIYPGRVLRLRVRGTRTSLTPYTSSDEFCAVMPGVIARFNGSDVQTLLQQRFQEMHSQFWDQSPPKKETDDTGNLYGKLPYQLWNVSKYGSCADAAITGIMPPPLMELQLLLLWTVK